MQTEGLLKQSQQLAAELQAQQKELQQTNEQLEQKAQQLAERNVEVERKNQEIEQARRALEEKAAELALTSKYKSEFLANMSHELRTPLNSILILGQQLTDNPDGNLTPSRSSSRRTIHGAGTDLLNLISDILDLSKIESGTVSVDAEEILVRQPRRTSWRGRSGTRPRRASCPSTCSSIRTSAAASSPTPKRLQQVLKNLLSNAFKFTEQGGVQLTVVARHERLDARSTRCSVRPPTVVAFEVSDTGIGIPPEKQKIIFEAFQQADAEHQPQIRRHRPRPRHQPRAREPARRRNPAAQHARQRQHLHALPAAQVCRPLGLGQAGRAGRRPGSSGAGEPPSAAWPIGRSSRSPTTGSRSSPATRFC